MSNHLIKTIHYKPYAAVEHALPAFSQKGKSVFITGGGTGIGAATALTFAKAGAAHVIITGRSKHTLDSSVASINSQYPSTKVHAYVADVTDSAAINDAFTDFTTKVGPIDTLVNNAGFQSTSAPGVQSDLADWWQSYETNVKGQFIPTAAFLKTKPEGRRGVIINLTTAIAWAFTFPGITAYGPSKLAGLRVSEIVAAEHPEVTSIAVSPGVVQTAMYEKAGGDALGFTLTEVDLTTGVFLWLTTPEANFLSGRSIEVNWDIVELKAAEKEIVEKKLFTATIEGWNDRVVPHYG